MTTISTFTRGAAILAALMVSALASAQTGVLKTHPANDPSGKILTMEETILSRDIHPSRITQDKIRELSDRGITFTGGGMMRRPPVTFRDGVLTWKDGDRDIVIVKAENDQIEYGQSVSRNEFGINGGLFLAPDGNKVAFYRNDQSKVTDFPLLDISTRTGTLVNIKYPMNGMDSERISLGVFDKTTGKTVYMNVTDFGEDRYLTNISWGPDSKYIFIQVLDRTQKHMRLNQYRADNGKFVRTILTEDNSKYVEPSDPLYFVGENYHFLYRTNNRDGFRNLYLGDTLGAVKRITTCDADVSYVRANGNTIFYTSAEISPIENHLFKVDLTPGKGKKAVSVLNTKVGKPVHLTPGNGTHSVSLSDDCRYFIDQFSSFNVPMEVYLRSTDGKESTLLHSSEDPLKDYASVEMVLGTVKSADGKWDNYYRLYKPLNFDPTKKYPVIVYVYGGPHSQMVSDTWLGQIRMWEMYMAQKGYVVYVQDNRGTQNRGLEFEQQIHRECGVHEMEDQMEGIKMLKSLPWVDADRIGVHGWSYGGFMTISLMTTYPETFKVGVAGGPVIDWKWYEVMYGERYMDTMETNPEGFEKTSLINKAKNLKGKLLICQGAIDNTVVWEHSLSFVQECIKNNIQLDYFPYPMAEHNVAGTHRVHLMDKVTMYFEDYL